ncbi:SAM-dependent methyltransferase [Streptomyces diacarni]|uniref:SAM-dependent methyltransferase n=1 Tax=Streptomyces diacarni TaxID=2800381 RepID=UPI001FEC5F46|nr:SAM-dependent methyltransferase [Streptomyces diacarni]
MPTEQNETEKSVSDAGFSPELIDTTTPHPARMYDYYLGGKDNYEADQRAARRVLDALPGIRETARGNRDFMHRAVRTVVAEHGIRQIIDIGTGIPTSPNTHEVARDVRSDVRVVYADNDPIVATYADAKLTHSGDAGFVLADIRDPKGILDHPVTRQLIDFDQPVALMLLAVLHFLRDDEDPAGIVASLTESLPAGSCLILSHGSPDFGGGSAVNKATGVYDSESTVSARIRSYEEVLPFFAGFDLLDPGLVQVPLWRPDGALPGADALPRYMAYAGVGLK